MIRTIDLRGRRLSRAELAAVLPRPSVDVAAAQESAADLIGEVRSRGSRALEEQAARFDGGRAPAIRVPRSEIAASVQTLAPGVRGALEEAIHRVRAAAAAQVPSPVTTEVAPGGLVHQRWQPVHRVGLYVPGGKAVYPSSVVMNAVPAQVAGVASIALASPSQAGSGVHPTILAAAGLLDIDEVYAMGGAGAIGALAYGVPELELDPVDVITGPGNVFVAAAKRLVRGQVGIDAEAGPTEILVIADATADPELIAADLVSQAEHDELAAAVLITDAVQVAERVGAAVVRRAAESRHSSRIAAAIGGPQSAIVLVDDLPAAARASDVYAPEHLAIQTAEPRAVLEMIHDAGAIFLGRHAPVSLGDYLAGSNHVLPTGGQARFSSGLSAMAFLRPQQVVEYSRAALDAVRAGLTALAEAEDLPAHAEAVQARFD